MIIKHLFLLLNVFLFCSFQTANALGTMAIDLGNEFIKVAIVKSGVPMEIVLNRESQRKTPGIISYRDKERFFGSPAESIAVKYPANAYHHIPSLIGKPLEHVSVQQFLKRFPFYELSFDSEFGQLVFKQGNKVVFTIEELMAMILENSRDIAQAYSDEIIKSAVITVPGHFGQAERRAILRAASLIDLNVHQLINENSAVALHYGVYRRSSINATAQHFVFFNIGSQYTSASLVSYSMQKEHGLETPQIAILGTASDPTLGITEFVVRLRDHLAKSFKEQHKLDVFKNSRAMMKLFKEAKRVVTILSANAETFAQVEYLMEQKDFKLKVTRTELEELCADLYPRIASVLDQTVSAASIPMTDIKDVILMGGGTRMPKIQETLLSVSGRTELGRNINSDEAAALGAVYQAAFHSPGFTVKRFEIKDFNFYPIKASYLKTVSETEKVDEEAVLYNRGNPYPQKRGLSIHKATSDMHINIKYGQTDDSTMLYVVPTAKHSSALMHVELFNVSEAINGTLATGATMKGFKVLFEMNMDGILSVRKVEARLEEKAEDSDAEKSTLESIGDSISGLFNSDQEKKEQVKTEEHTTTPAPEKKNSESDKKKENKTPKIISLPIKFSFEYLDMPTPSNEVMEASKKKLKDLKEYETQIIELERSRNDLESYLFRTRERLDEKPFEEFSTELDRKAISDALKLASDWYDEQGADTSKESYDKQLITLQDAVKPVDNRMSEHKKMPQAFDKMSESINSAEEFHKLFDQFINEPYMDKLFGNMSELFSDFPINDHVDSLNALIQEQVSKSFKKEELDVFKKLIDEQKVWLMESKALMAKHPKHEDASVKVSDVVDKQGNLVRQMTSISDKVDNNKHTIRLEIIKWIHNKNKEIKESESASNATTTASEPVASSEDQPKDDAKAEDKQDEKSTTTPRSDL